VRDAERARRFYLETLELRPDEHSKWEFWVGDTCFALWQPEQWGDEFDPQRNAIALLHVDDVEAARAELAAKGVEFVGEIVDTSVCHMATFKDPDGNQLVLHKRYAPYES
jgi:predicted enzyme related to lactoylglutathione lyase